MSERNYWVLCDDNCKFEGMTKEQIIAAIAEATGATPTQIDAAFITKIKEQNKNTPLKFWIGTQAEYNALETIDNNTFYIFSDTDELPSIIQAAEEKAEEVCAELATVVTGIQNDVDDLGDRLDDDENDISEIQTTLNRKGAVLWSASDPTTLLNKTIQNLADYKMVFILMNDGGIGEIPCVVQDNGEYYIIKGMSNGLLSSENASLVGYINLNVSYEGVVTADRSYKIVNGTSSAARSFYSKVTGLW